VWRAELEPGASALHASRASPGESRARCFVRHLSPPRVKSYFYSLHGAYRYTKWSHDLTMCLRPSLRTAARTHGAAPAPRVYLMNEPSRSCRHNLLRRETSQRRGASVHGVASCKKAGGPVKKRSRREVKRQTGAVVSTTVNPARSKARTPIRKFSSPAANQERWQVDRPIQQRGKSDQSVLKARGNLRVQQGLTRLCYQPAFAGWELLCPSSLNKRWIQAVCSTRSTLIAHRLSDAHTMDLS
jgi:hypothetical protein